jgi:hypothetical protein
MTTNILRRSAWTILLGLVWAVSSPAWGGDEPTEKAAPKKPAVKIIPVAIHPAAAPVPALKYHLLPTFLEQTPGDAVPLYVKALVGYMEFSRHFGSPKDDFDLDLAKKWMETPLDALPRDRVRKWMKFGGFRSLKSAVRRERCNWEPTVREGRAWEILLPEMQELRYMSWLVALSGRLQIADGKYAEAIETLQIGYGMGRQIAECPFLVTSMIGKVIVEEMNDQLLTLCQQPGAPNLYWSLAALPSPIINLDRSLAYEYDSLYFQYPELQNVRHARNAPAQWDIILHKLVSEVVHYQEALERKSPEGDRVSKIIALALVAVPRAKAELIAAGYSQKDVEAMPPSQIIVLHAVETHDRIRDEQQKWSRLPYWQAQEGLAAFERDLESAKKRELIPLASPYLPNVQLAMFGIARTERQLAALRCIEALRLYAAAHAGKLPASLGDIKQAPIPTNPVTGRAFPYHLEGETAVLDADGGPDGVEYAQTQYRITVAK